jgi:hypothetical protein
VAELNELDLAKPFCIHIRVIASTEDHMPRYRTKGTDLLDANGSKVATVRGAEIYDAANNRIATLRHLEVYDSENKLVAVLRDSGVYDAKDRKIATLSDIYHDIDSVLGGPTLIGLWVFFVRKQSPTVQAPPSNGWSLFQRMFRFGG